MKKTRCIVFLLLCCFLLSGCDFLLPFDKPSEETYWDGTKYQSVFATQWQYQQLSDIEKRGYGQLFTAVYDNLEKDTTITDINDNERPGLRVTLQDVPMTKTEMAHLFEAFFRDNPQFIHLDRTYSLEGTENNGLHLYDTFLLQFTMDAEQRMRSLKKMNQAIADITNRCPKTDDDYVKELYLHDQLVALCEYDDDAAASTSQKYANAYSAYGALIEKKAVCEGYAKAMQLLLNAVSIPATVVFGQVAEDNEAHMWNLVYINNAYYYLDPTWNDSDAIPQYAYFNMTSDMLSRTHLIEPGQSLPDNCRSTADNYFVRQNTYIDTYEREVIAKTIAEQIQDGHEIIHLRFGDGKYENGLLFLKNSTLTQRLVGNHLGGTSMWKYELRTQAKQNVVTLHRVK